MLNPGLMDCNWPGPRLGLGWAGAVWRAGLCCVGDPGVAFGGADEGVEPADAVAGGGGEVGADGAEGLGAAHGAHAAGDLDPQLAHPYDLLGWVVIERDAQVIGESQVVFGAVAHPGGQG